MESISLTGAYPLADLWSVSTWEGDSPAPLVPLVVEKGRVSFEAIFSRWDGLPAGFPDADDSSLDVLDVSGSLSGNGADDFDFDSLSVENADSFEVDDVWLLFGWMSVLCFNFFFFFLPYEELLLLDDDDDEDEVDEEVYEYEEAEK